MPEYFQMSANSIFQSLHKLVNTNIDTIQKTATQYLERQDFERAKRVISILEKLKTIKTAIEFVTKEWNSLQDQISSFTESNKMPQTSPTRRSSDGRIRHGLRTPVKDFFIPIFRALVQLGGRAEVDEVLKKVEHLMKDVLTDLDYKRLPKNPDLRWRNTAQWARFLMVKQDLLKADSPRGIWEISEKGRRFLSQSRDEY